MECHFSETKDENGNKSLETKIPQSLHIHLDRPLNNCIIDDTMQAYIAEFLDLAEL